MYITGKGSSSTYTLLLTGTIFSDFCLILIYVELILVKAGAGKCRCMHIICTDGIPGKGLSQYSTYTYTYVVRVIAVQGKHSACMLEIEMTINICPLSYHSTYIPSKG